FIGFVLLSAFGPGNAPLNVELLLAITGAGMGLSNSTMLNTASLIVPARHVGLGIGLFNMFFFLGGAFGATISTTILEARLHVTDAINPLHSGAGAGFSDAMLASVVCAFIALVLIWRVRVPRPGQ